MSKNVPKLRFKEFTGEWEEKKLGDVCTLITKGTSPKKYDETSDINFIKIESIKNGSIELDKCKKISTAVHEGELKRSMLNKGDILYGIAGSLGTIAIVGENHIPANTNQALAILRGKSDLNREYVMQVFKSEASKRFIYKNVSIGAQPNLSLEQMASFRVPYPVISEQTKIANFLSTIDSRITIQSDKVGILSELKKGLMQKIFSQEIRFKREDGGEYPKWEERVLGDIANIIKSSGLSKSDLGTRGEPCILYGELYTKYSEIINFVKSKTEKKLESLVKSRYGDVIIPSSGETPEDIATASCVLKNDVLYGGDLNIIRSTEYDGRFLSYQLNHHKRYDIAALAQGATVSHLYGKSLAKLVVLIADIEEQQKIADFLSTIDSKIDIETQILSTLQTLKKGLLQQMFV